MQFVNRWTMWCMTTTAAMMTAACVPQAGDVGPNGEIKETNSYLTAENPVPNEYLFVLNEGCAGIQSVHTMADEVADAYAGTVLRTYSQTLNGGLVEIEDEDLAIAMAYDPCVEFVEQNGWVTLDAAQNNAPWGLDRIDQANLPLNDQFVVESNDGAGVHVYVIDTGIRATHEEFEGRVSNGFDAVDGDFNPDDCNGHGTHVAGTAVGTTFGVAKAATLHGVRVLNCNGSGSFADIIEGIEWVTQNHQDPAVANMSLGGGAAAAIDAAVQRSINAGVTHVVAAGNDNANACGFSPARAPEAITVGATAINDGRANFSNFGQCVDIFAPGVNIESAWIGGDNDTLAISGTSMASPHVAGVAALFLGEQSNATPAQVHSAIVNGGVSGRVRNPGNGSPNVLLNTAFITSETPPGNNDPKPDPDPDPEPSADSFSYRARRTRSARVGATQDIAMQAGQTIRIGTCGVEGASAQGDTFLRLKVGDTFVRQNDDACGGLTSFIQATASQDVTVTVVAGCYRNTRCEGTVSWTLE